jgi:hypothetical protein
MILLLCHGWGASTYLMVPGQEIAGIVIQEWLTGRLSANSLILAGNEAFAIKGLNGIVSEED